MYSILQNLTCTNKSLDPQSMIGSGNDQSISIDKISGLVLIGSTHKKSSSSIGCGLPKLVSIDCFSGVISLA